MEFNFEDFRGECFSIDGKKLQTYEECKEWLAIKYHYRGWDVLVRMIDDRGIVKMFEEQAMDLYTYLLGKEQIK